MRLGLEVGFLVIFDIVKQLFNIFILLVLTVFSTQQIGANDVFLLTEKSYSSVEDINNAGGGISEALESAIKAGKRSDGSLAKALNDAEFPKSSKAVTNSSKVNRNNKKGLDLGDSGLPNAKEDYTFIKDGQEFEKLDNETWGDFFARLKNNGFNVFESHHIFPVDLFKQSSFRKWYELIGNKHFNINGENSLENLIMLEKKIVNNGGVHSRHDAYTKKIGDYFNSRWSEIKKSNPSWSDLQIAEELDLDIINLAKKLKKSLLDNSVKSNVEISKYWDTINFDDLIH